MAKKRKPEDRSPTIAGAFAPPPVGSRSKQMMLAVAAIVLVCFVVFLVAQSLG